MSGYLLRLAEANGFTVFWDLVRDLFPRWETAKQLPLLRWEYPVDDWGRIPVRTQLSPTQLRAMSVAPWLEKFRAPVALSRPGRLSPGHWLRGAVRPNLQVCPACLQAQPFVRLLWRLMPVRVCVEHGCSLQGQCSGCGHTLRAISPRQRHLRCAECGMDLRRLPIVPVPKDLIAEQARRQANLQLLLDPGTRLIQFAHGETQTCGDELPQAIGRKLRFLRQRAGASPGEIAQKLGVAPAMIGMIETGHPTALALYLSYLETLSLSWSDFAAVQVPAEFHVHEPLPLLALRVCPTPDCPNHQGPSERVSLHGDLTDRQKAYFHCPACGRRFTRQYDGTLVTKRSQSSTRPIHTLEVTKPHNELMRLLDLGRQGFSDKQVAPRLGWSLNTVRRYWIVLGVEEEIHRAQVERRLRERQERNADLATRVEEVLQLLLQQNEEITLHWVTQALQCTWDRLKGCPGLIDHIRAVAQARNQQVLQHREDALLAQLMEAFADLTRNGHLMTIRSVTGRVGISSPLLEATSPKLYAIVRQTVAEYNASIKDEQRREQCQHINEAAVRLAARGIRLTYVGILKEAGVHRNRKEADPVIRGLLDRWISDRTQGE